MRKKGSTSLLTEERNRDLMRAYREVISQELENEGQIDANTLIRKTVNSPASRYWVSPERASSIMLLMEKGKSIRGMKRNTIRLYRALFKEFKKYRKEHPEMCANHIVERIILLPAPFFAISPRVAGNIIYKMKSICKSEKIKKLQHLYVS